MEHTGKKMKPIFMFFTVLMVCFLANSQLIQAGSNSSQQTSQEIDVNQIIQGEMDSSYSWYITTLSEDGYFYVDFNRASEDGDHYSNAGWRLSVYVDGKFILDNCYITESQAAYTSPVYPYPKGTTVYVRIQDAGAKTNVPYQFQVVNQASKEWESEANDSKATADSIAVNKYYNGNFALNDSYDYYKTTLNKTGTMQLMFGRLNQDGDRYMNAGWYVSLIVGDKIILDSAYVTEDAALNGYSSPLFGYQKGQVIYIRVENHGAGNNVDYRFCVKNAASSSWETEGNNTKKSADAIKMNKAYNGNFHKDDVMDYFTAKASKTGTFKMAFGRRMDTGDRYVNAGWYVTVYVGNKKVLDAQYVTESQALDGYLSGRYKVKKGQKIVVLVENHGAGNSVDYSFKLKMK